MSRILVIEDDVQVQESISDLLETRNFEVLIANNGKDGILMAAEHNPDLIICDIMMASLNGYSVLHSVKTMPELQSVPFIFISALAEQKYINMGIEKGADYYLVKPFRSDELFTVVNKLLNKS